MVPAVWSLVFDPFGTFFFVLSGSLLVAQL